MAEKKIEVVPCPLHEWNRVVVEQSDDGTKVVWPYPLPKCCGTEAEARAKAAEVESQQLLASVGKPLGTNINFAAARTETRPPDEWNLETCCKTSDPCEPHAQFPMTEKMIVARASATVEPRPKDECWHEDADGFCGAPKAKHRTGKSDYEHDFVADEPIHRRVATPELVEPSPRPQEILCSFCGKPLSLYWHDKLEDAIACREKVVAGLPAAAPSPVARPQFVQGACVPLSNPQIWWWTCRICGTSTAGEKEPTEHVCANPKGHAEPAARTEQPTPRYSTCKDCAEKIYREEKWVHCDAATDSKHDAIPEPQPIYATCPKCGGCIYPHHDECIQCDCAAPVVVEPRRIDIQIYDRLVKYLSLNLNEHNEYTQREALQLLSELGELAESQRTEGAVKK